MDIPASVPQGAAPDVASQFGGNEISKPGYSLYVWLSDDKVECRCSYVPHDQGSMLTREEFGAYLRSAGVVEGFIEDAVDDFVIRAAAGQTQSMVLIARGTPPVSGKDGWLSYIAHPSVVESHETDESGNIDLHNVQTFINVMPGDEIARVMPPEPGCDGRSVTGATIPFQPGKPLSLKIGENISMRDDGSLLIAETAGRVCLATGEISVAQEYVVSGDVNFRIGSIVFNGFVEVRGDVLDGFNVTAVKGLRVNGNIGACVIKSDGDVAFCGMDGQERGSIECNGSVIANFVHNCTVTCGGDVVVEVELHNCQVNSLGRITVNKGAVTGGCYTALKGVETKKVGSPASVPTVLKAGVDYRDVAELEHLLAELEENSAQMKQADSLQEMEKLRKVRGEMMARMSVIRGRNDQANPKINVKAMLYDNSFLQIGMTQKQKVDEKDGPFSVIENTVDGGLRFLSLTSLDVRAEDIELAFVREQVLKR